jgi:Holliday junction DNA helicase RuvA
VIGRLTGRLSAKHPPQVLVDVGGVAYEIDVPMSTFYGLPATGESLTLHTHLIVREDAHMLYGFATLEERAAFRRLIRISGIGARIALAVLSGLSVADLAHAVAMQEPGRLTRIPGIGKKTAERLLLELKGKLADAVPAGGAVAAPLQREGGARGDQRPAVRRCGRRWHPAGAEEPRPGLNRARVDRRRGAD